MSHPRSWSGKLVTTSLVRWEKYMVSEDGLALWLFVNIEAFAAREWMRDGAWRGMATRPKEQTAHTAPPAHHNHSSGFLHLTIYFFSLQIGSFICKGRGSGWIKKGHFSLRKALKCHLTACVCLSKPTAKKTQNFMESKPAHFTWWNCLLNITRRQWGSLPPRHRDGLKGHCARSHLCGFILTPQHTYCWCEVKVSSPSLMVGNKCL